ncbi:hypothetical protein J4Q44_G00365320 [Coregonus suidteri]|uniref:GPI ethanolamine phosphate transferase 1 n=1 Tax=Coregonus suidteri TaxID=861788 RepID=A0AAN8QAZ0_9TELE
MYSNAIQILEQFKVKMAQKKETTLSFLFTPYQLLTESRQAEFINKARVLIQLEEYEEAVSYMDIKPGYLSLMGHALEGLSYYHTYDRFFLGCSVVLGFTGWTSYVVLVILKTHASLRRPPTDQVSGKTLWWMGVGATLLIGMFLTIQRSPVTYYIYCLLPVPVWYSVLKEFGTLTDLGGEFLPSGHADCRPGVSLSLAPALWPLQQGQV